MKFEVKAIELKTGLTVHLTGKWNSRADMEHELMADGLAVTWYTRLK